MSPPSSATKNKPSKKPLWKLCLSPAFTQGFCLAYSSTPKTESTCCTETWVNFQRTTWRYIPEDRTLQANFFLSVKHHSRYGIVCLNVHSMTRPVVLYIKRAAKKTSSRMTAAVWAHFQDVLKNATFTKPAHSRPSLYRGFDHIPPHIDCIYFMTKKFL
jgi:hypothetical protein